MILLRLRLKENDSSTNRSNHGRFLFVFLTILKFVQLTVRRVEISDRNWLNKTYPKCYLRIFCNMDRAIKGGKGDVGGIESGNT